MIIQLKHSVSGLVKEAKIGFSWTSLFFGFFVPLFRSDFVWAVIYFILTGITLGIFWLICPFIYNKIYIKKLLEKGYIPANKYSEDLLVSKNLLFRNPSVNATSNTLPAAAENPTSNKTSNSDATVSSVEPKFTGSVEEIVNNVLREHHGRGKHVLSKINGNITPKLKDNLKKHFPALESKGEEIIIGIQSWGTFFVITQNYYCMRLADYTCETFKANTLSEITTTNLYADEDALSSHAILKLTDLANPKKPIGNIVDMAWPFNRHKNDDVKLVVEVVYKISRSIFGENAKKPDFLDSFRG
ncbi:MAG: hypothetical protein ACKO2G_09200 [Verrucomicrobiales bacterium]